MMTVSGDPAVCHNNNCGYRFKAPVAQITSFKYEKSAKKLTIVGTDLPTSNIKVEFGL
jgi:hypothetical protein